MLEEKTMVVMIGLQGSGKSEYVRQNLSDLVWVNLDTLHTRNREQLLIHACFDSGQSFVVDNTNPTKEDRQRYIVPAKKRGYRVIGLYMQSVLRDCIERNNRREGKARIPPKAIACTSNKLELPDYGEGFDELYYVHNDGTTMWKEEWVR